MALAAMLIAAAACGGVQLGSRTTPTPRPSQSVPARNAGNQNLDAAEFYRRWGMLAQGAPLPFTGSIAFLAAPRGDSTHAMISLSIAAGTLKFNREGDGYRADYRVSITLARDGATVARIDAAEPLRVATLRETRRTDESVLFQQVITVPSGQYTMSLTVRDEGSGLSSNQDVLVQVPRFGDGATTAPLAYYDVVRRVTRDSLPRLVASPRAAATFGGDSAIAVYLEAYGSQSPPYLMLAVRVDSQTVWTDTVPLTRGDGLATGTARVPVSRIGLGVAVVHVWQPGGNDTTRTPVFVGIGDELPTTTYRDMLSYLRFFTTGARLAQLEAVPPALRGTAWREFGRETDPTPATPENEALTDYLVRLRRANERFLGEGAAGWKTDRGMVLLLLGEPDQVVDQGANDVSQRGRVQRWEYNALGYSVEFLYVASVSQWRLASATEAQVRDAARRRAGP